MTKNNLKLESFFQDIRSDVDKEIKNILKDKNIMKALKGGKRLRPFLTQLSFKTCTQGKETLPQYKKSLEGTITIELAHSASLVHDDIIDKDEERRGNSALHIKEGISKAILVGHKMLNRGLNIALNHGKELTNLYVETWKDVVDGEINEIDFNKGNRNIKQKFSTKSQIFEAYKRIIDLKTAKLFASSCKAGALEANMARDISQVFYKYGREIGLAYQLADDLVDLANGELLDSVILPLLNQLEDSKTIKKLKENKIKKKLENNRKEVEEFYIKEIKKHVKNAEKLANSGKIPNSGYKNLLQDAPRYIINKMLKEIKITI
ncbi:MAG: polyprenyl synthetase family protein [Candidatus Thermoplasmatota archaeon]